MASQSSQSLHPMLSQFVWSDNTGRGRNRYVAFRRAFSLAAVPASATFHLFADTRYRLMVNGQTLCHGPARYTLSHPEYDSIDLAPYLRQGDNVIAVLINSYNCNSFHSDISVGALACTGEIRDGAKTIDLTSGPQWKCQPLAAYRPDTHALSFALNPAEHLDANKLPAGWDLPGFDDSDWSPVVAHANTSNWGQLKPRSIPMLDERAILPRRRIATFAARRQPDETVASLVIEVGSGEQRPRSTLMVATWIHSPKRQQVMLGAWWGEYALNGAKLVPIKRHDVALRQDFAVELNEGWNLSMVRESWGQDAWDFHLAYPTSAGLTLSAEQKLDCPDRFLTAGPWSGKQAEAAAVLPLDASTASALPADLGRWKRISRQHSASNPIRERAWKRFELLDHHADLACDGAVYAQVVGRDTLCLLYDFGTEILGRIRLDFEAAQGTTVDVTYTERLKRDGVSDVHQRFFQDIAERYIARTGKQTWHQMHPRGGRYVEVLVTGDLSQFRLHGIELTRAAYPVQEIGAFDCGDPVLRDIWKLGQRTQAACMEDAYLDCPMRERGLYAGDMLVQYLVNLASFGDHALARRCIEIFLYHQSDKNGLVPGGAFGLPAGRHPDYSAILVQAIWQYYWRTGDAQWLRYIEPYLRRMLNGLASLKVAGSDLLDGSDIHPYIDLQKMDRGGINCALNCFYQKAFADAASIYTAIGDKSCAQVWQQAAAKLAVAIRAEFWDNARGVFTDRRAGDVERPEPSVAANALALLYDIASPEQARLAIEYLSDAMAHNFTVESPKRNDECRVTSYFSFYALGALTKAGRVDEAVAFIRKYWLHTLDQGAWTCWEYFIDTEDSLCHAWSACPTHYLSQLILGVSFPEAGNPNKVVIRPHSGNLQWARGVYPHPAGPIRVSWQKAANGQLDLQIDAPPGVTVL